MRRIVGGTAATVLTGLLLLASVGPVHASCNPVTYNPARNSSSWDPQWVSISQTPGATVEGVSSYIWNYAPYVPSGQFSYSWVFLYGGSNKWAQVGNYEAVQGRSTLVQVNNGGSPTDWEFAAEPLNSFTQYKTLWINGYFQFWAGGSLLYDVNWMTWTPYNAEVAAEITAVNTQMMGAWSNNEEFEYNSIMYGNNSWLAMSAPVQVTGADGGHPNWFGDLGNSSTFYAWDEDCQQ